MKHTTDKVFILENGSYVEISYEELCRRTELDESYEDKLFLPLHGMLVEVAEEEYKTFYKNVRRQKYLRELSVENEDFSYDILTTEDFNGEDILIDKEQDIEAIVEKKLMLDKLHNSLSLLSPEERRLIRAIYFEDLTEREFAKKQGVSQNAIHKRKQRILEKIKKILEI